MTELHEPLPPPPPPAPVPAGWEGILQPGEAILWQGRPDGRIELTPRDLPEIGFGVIFTGFAVFWTGSAWARGAPILFTAFGLPFVLVGLSIMLRSTLIAGLRRRNTWYTLSNRRAFIATDLPLRGRSLQSYPLGRESVLELDQRGDLFTLTFARKRATASERVGRELPIAFERIADGHKVLSLMRQVQGGTT